ncbi:PKD-like domain-containing protein [Chryseotalea sanaruensis]|uniref:PKD-like domain-containing protein n=1 Tax=Chryseotalea sanaruensis TaxID=2482724 RepID=UPI001C3FA0CA
MNNGTSVQTATITVTPIYNGCTGATQDVVLTVNPTPVLTSTLTPAAICSGDTFSYTPTSATVGATFAWSRALVAGISQGVSSGSGNISEVLTNTTATPINVTYIITSTIGTCSNAGQSVVVRVNPTPALSSSLTPAAICSGDTFSYTPTSVTVGATFSWSRAVVVGITEAAGTGTNDPNETLTNTTSLPINVTYEYTISANGCSQVQNVVVSVNPTPVVANPADETVCAGSAVTAINFTGTATSYSWTNTNTSIGLAGSGTGNIASFTAVNNGTSVQTATITVTPIYNGCTGATQDVVITVNPTPVLTSTLTPAAICSGDTFSYTPTSATVGATFAWSRALVAGISQAASSSTGAISEVLTNTTATPINVTYIITSTIGTCSNAGQSVVVRVNPTPALSSSLTPAAICSGDTFSYTPASVTVGATFSWSRAVVVGITEAAGTGTNDPNETLTNTTSLPINVTYEYTISANGCSQVQNVVVSVNPTPVVANPADETVCAGSAVTAINFTGTATSYSWTNSNTSIGLAGIGTGNIASFTAVNNGTSVQTATITVTPIYNGCTGATQDVVLTVNPTPVLTSTLTPAAICSGDTFSYTPTSATVGATFAWSRALVAGISQAASSSTGAISEVLTNTTATPINVTYIITSTIGTCSNAGQSVVVRVNPTPALSSSLTPAAICSGDTFSYTPTSVTVGATFSWSRAVVVGITEAAGTGTNDPNETLTNTTSLPINVTYEYTIAANGCSQVQNVVVSVNPTPVVANPADETVCAGSAVTAINFTGTATSYSWTNTNTSIGLAGSGTGNIASFTAVNNGTSVQTATITVTPIYNGCTGATQDVVITVNPTPVLTSTLTPAAICSGDTFSYTPTSATVGATFAWSRALVAGISQGVSSGSGNISEVLTNTTATPINVTYIITSTIGTCSNAGQSVVVRVNPTPALSSSLTPAAICSGDTFSYTPTSVTVGATFSWSRAVVVGITEAAGTGTNDPNETLTNTTSLPINVTYEYTISANGCSQVQNVVVSVNPTPVVANPADETVCAGSAVTAINFTGTATSYSWTNSNTSIGLAGIGTGNIASFTAVNNGTSVQTATITVTPIYNGCTGATQDVVITVNPTPVLTSSLTPAAICSGDTFSYTPASATVGATFAWSRALVAGISQGVSSGSGNISEVLTNTTATPINVTYIITSTIGTCSNAGQSVVVRVNPTPALSSSLTPAAICSGDTFSYTPASATVGATFSWSRAVVVGITEAAGTGTNDPNETLTNTTSLPINVTYEYTISANGCSQVQNVVVSVNPTPVVANPADETVCAGSAVTAINFTGTATSYSWTNSNTSIGLAGSGTGNIASFTAVNNGTSVQTATITVTPIYNGCTGATQDVVLTVNPTPVLTSTLTPAAICSGDTFSYTPTSATVGATFAWSRALVAGISQAASSSTGAISEVLTNTTATPINVTYIITSTIGTCSNAGQSVVVRVNPTPALSSSLTPAAICSGDTFSYTPTSVTVGATFSWSRAVVVGITEAAGTGTNDPNETLTNTTSLPINVTYEYTISANGCSQVQNVVVSVNPTPVVANPADETVCAGSAVTAINFTGTATSYSWTNTNTSIGLAGSGTGNIASFTAVNNGTSVQTATITVTPIYNGCTGATQDVVLTVNPIPNVSAPNAVICSGSTTSIALSNPNAVTGTLYRWTVVQSGVSGASNQATSVAGPIAHTLSTTSSNPGTATYTITPIANGCLGTSTTVVVTVNPIPNALATPSAQTICSGETTNIALTNPNVVTGTTYSWTVSATNVTGASSGSGNTISQLLSSTTGNTTGTVIYTITPRANGCNGAAITATITVNPNPTLAINNTTFTVCNGQTPTIILTNPNNVAGAGYVWTVSSTNINGLVNQNTPVAASAINTALILTTANTSGQAVYNVRSVLNGCYSAVQSITVNVNPIPTVLASNASICSGSTTNINITNPNAVTGTTYTWTRVSTNVSGANAGSGNVISQLLTSTDGINSGNVVYTITPSANGCAGTPSSITVTVNPSPTFNVVNSTTEICSGTATNLVFTSPTNGHRINVISVNYGAVSGGTVIAGTTTFTNSNVLIETLTNNTNAPINVVYTFNVTTPLTAPVCPISPVTQTVIVRVLPRPVFSIVNNNTQICSEEKTNIALTTSVTGARIRLVSVNYSAATGTLVAGAIFENAQVVEDLLINPTNSSTTVNYTFEALVGSCLPSSSQVVSVLVRPRPVITTASTLLTKEICSGQALSFTATTSPASTVNWTAVYTSQINGASISSSGSGPITNTPINISNVNGTVTYTLTPVVNGCVGASRDYVVTVKPLPSVTTSNVIICSESVALLNLSSSPQNISGTTYSWTTSNLGVVSGQSNGDGSSISQTLVSNHLGGVVSYTITPAANGCFGPSAVYTATVNPKAIVNAGPDFAVCEPTDVAIAGSLAGSATVGTWSVVSGQGSGSVAGTGLNDIYTVAPTDIGNSVTLLLTSNDPDGAGPCPIVTDQLVIAVNRQARVTAPADYTLCEPTDFMLTSTLSGSATSGSWSVIDGDGTLTVSSITLNNVSATYIPAITDVSTSLQFRITTNDPDGTGPCLVASDDVVININQAARITAGSDFEVCEDEPLVLNGTKSGATSVVTWTGGTGTFANASAESTAYSLSAAEFNALSQVLTFRLTTDDPDGAGPCTSVFDEVMVTVNDTTEIIFFGLDPVYAENQPPVTLLPNPSGGVFTGSGITAGTTIFSPEFANVGSINKITYTYINPVTSCSSIFSRNTIVNPITTVAFRFEDNKGAVEVNQNLVTLCAETGDIELIGDPLVNTPPVAPVNAFFSSTTAGIISQVGLRYFLRTNGLAGGSYFITYTYTNEFNATNSITREVYVYSAPQSRIRGLAAGGDVNNDADLLSSIDGCISDDVQFVGRASDIINNQTGASIVEYNWNFDDNGNTSVSENPIYSFGQSRFYNISLRVRTNQQCFSDTTIAVQVGKPPLVDFSWSKVCSGDVTEFENDSKTGISKALAVNWDFGDMTILNKEPLTFGDTVNINTPWSPHHMFPAGPAQAYDITLTVKTEEGCSASLTKNAFILTSGDAQQLASTGYREDFRNGQGTWFPTNSTLENVTATSWNFGLPDGTTIDNAINNAWYMREYQNIDNSVVIGPCLNLSGLTKPMISLDFWSDTDEQLDGTVLQYSIDEGDTWVVLGDNSGNGINWYKSSTITGDPGNQTITTFNRFGWSGDSGGWQNARYSLDEIPLTERDKVVFRIAFGSNNPSDRTYNGFAFDNIYIGDKQKLVLLEHFTNNTTTLVNFNNEIDDAYAADTIGRDRQSNFLKLQYHMANPNASDEFSLNNPADPSVRSFFYGVETPPFTIMNGALGNYTVGDFNPFTTNFNGLFSRITPQVINREALLAPKFNLQLELDVNNNDEDKIEFKTSLTYVDSISVNFNEAVNVYVVLYESGVRAEESPVENVMFKNVMRQMLSGSGGITINQPWVWGGLGVSPTIREAVVDLRTQFQETDSLWVVAFVQNRNTREIYQTVIQKVVKPKVPLLPVGLEEEIVKTELEQIEMYPNPASNKVNLYAEGILSQQYDWKIINQQGVQVMSGKLEREFFTPKEIMTEQLADGVYFMVFGTKGEPLHYKKLVIVNRQ